MTRHFIFILILALIISCSSTDRQVNDKDNLETTVTADRKDTSKYEPDTLYTTKGESSPFALKDLKLGKNILSPSMTTADIVKNKIKTIRREGLNTEQFDKRGFKIFEKYDAWNWGSKFQYTFDENGKPLTISILDTNNIIIGTAKYKYDSLGKLLQAGEYVLKYYPNGQLKSVEDAGEIERYGYDSNGNLNHIYFDWQAGVLGCGNRTTEWRGEYNDKRQLTKELSFGFPSGETTYFEYSEAGQIIKEKSTLSIGKTTTTTDYIYNNGLLTEKKTFDETGMLKYSTKFTYEKY